MPLTLNELYTQTKQQYHFSMIAGEAGIDHIMNWVYVSEDSSTTVRMRPHFMILLKR